ncbi:MAG TPA: MASE1 domain-containing protein [Chthonomonadaceae bacterium]|nr:MASE1 domain-containing protein [Chthonomonadaceae bacterium]
MHRPTRSLNFTYASYWLQTLAFALVYFGSARLGLLMAFGHRNVSPVWLASGVALAGLLLLGPRFWPGVTLGAFLANFTTGLPLLTACGIGVGNTLEAVLGAYLLRRFARFQNSLGRLQDVLALLFLAAIGSTVAAATIGVVSLEIGGVLRWSDAAPAWWTWWLGDGMGILIVTPLLLTWATPQPFLQKRAWGPGRIAEAATLAVLLPLACCFIFTSGRDYPYAIFPLAIWAAVRFGQRGVATANLAISILAVWGTLQGLGPFIKATPEQSLNYLQTFLGIVSAAGLLLAAVITERRQVEEALGESERRFMLALENSATTVYSQDRDLRYTWIFDGKHRFPPETILGKTDADLAPTEDAAPLAEIKRRVLTTGVGERQEVRATTRGITSFYDLVAEPMRDETGAIVGISGTATDITEIKRYQAHIEALNEQLRRAMLETHHRVKNNLQIIASMIDMQLMQDTETLPVKEIERLASHVRTLAIVHELLTHEAKESGQAHAVAAREILEKLLSLLQQTAPEREIRACLEDTLLPIREATSLALVTNEIVHNAIKHGRGPVEVHFTVRDDAATLAVSDDGPGFPDGLTPSSTDTTGLALVESLSRWDLRGATRYTNRPEGGARCEVIFSVSSPSAPAPPSV